MANLILTNQCNLNCSFCFAIENNYGVTKTTKEEFNVADLWKISGFLKDQTIRLCGGEPTINSNIIEIMESLLSNNYRVLLMTNGLWKDSFRKFITKLPAYAINRISYLFNILDPGFYSSAQLKNLREVLEIVNPARITLGVTISEGNFEYRHLINLCEEYSIKSIRISIAAPNISGGEYKLENEFYSIAERLHGFLLECTERNINVQKDCNYIPPCFFTNEQLMDIKFCVSGNWNFTCASSPVDIDVNGNSWRCFGLFSLLQAKISDFAKEEDLKAYFNRRMRLISKNLLAYEECSDCSYWQKSCLGGCFTIQIKKIFEQNPNITIVPIDDDREVFNCKPIRNNSVVIREDKSGSRVYSNNMVLDNPDENISSFLSTIDGKLSLNDLAEIWCENFSNLEEAKSEVVKMCKMLFERDLVDIVYNYNVSIKKRPRRQNVTNKRTHQTI